MPTFLNLRRPVQTRPNEWQGLQHWQQHTTDNIDRINRALAPQYGFLAMSGPQTLSDNSDTPIIWGSLDSNGVSIDGTDASHIVIANAGIYLVTAHVNFDADPSATGVRSCWLTASNSEGLRGYQLVPASPAGNDTTINSSAQWRLDAGDYVQFWAYQNSGSDLDVLGLPTREEATKLQVVRIA